MEGDEEAPGVFLHWLPETWAVVHKQLGLMLEEGVRLKGSWGPLYDEVKKGSVRRNI